MAEVVESLALLRNRTANWRERGQTIGFVPTMGNLHIGHLKLIDQARARCDRVVASVFVNPTQFGPGEDFESYPRTREADLAALEQAGCDLVWMPSVAIMYPLEKPFMVQVPEFLADRLCGRSRPGHFNGVASVVLRLFHQVGPELAVFGEKDYQQLLIIRQMVSDLSLPVEIEGLETVREGDGLAMSSRNAYLDQAQRQAAPELYRTLAEMAERLARGDSFGSLREAALAQLCATGFRPDYLEWRSALDLGEPAAGQPSRLFAAAWLGRARLIDNVAVIQNQSGSTQARQA